MSEVRQPAGGSPPAPPPLRQTYAVLRQALWAVTLLLGVVVGSFLLFILVPGDPARVILGPNATEEAVVRLARQLGTDQPIGEQLAAYFRRLAQLDLGRSVVDGRSVREEVVAKFAVTLRIGVLAALLALLGSYVVNVVAFLRPRLSGLVTLVRGGIVVPTFFSGVVAALVLGVWVPVVPLSGGGSVLATTLLPAVIVALYPLALMTRILHEQIQTTAAAPFAVAARALGHTERRVFHRALLRPVAVTWLAAWVNQLSIIFLASFVVEVIFTIPGIGPLLIGAIQRKDYPLLQGIILLNAVFFIALHFASELLFRVVDPRARYA